MTAKDQYNPVPEPRQDADIISMLDEMLARDELAIKQTVDGWHVVELDPENPNIWTTIDIYETRASAYRSAIDCLIELCIAGWEQGGQE